MHTPGGRWGQLLTGAELPVEGLEGLLASGKKGVAWQGHAPVWGWRGQAGFQQLAALLIIQEQVPSQFEDRRFARGEYVSQFPATNGMPMHPEALGQARLGEVLAVAKRFEQRAKGRRLHAGGDQGLPAPFSNLVLLSQDAPFFGTSALLYFHTVMKSKPSHCGLREEDQEKGGKWSKAQRGISGRVSMRCMVGDKKPPEAGGTLKTRWLSRMVWGCSRDAGRTRSKVGQRAAVLDTTRATSLGPQRRHARPLSGPFLARMINHRQSA